MGNIATKFYNYVSYHPSQVCFQINIYINHILFSIVKKKLLYIHVCIDDLFFFVF